MSQRFLIFEQDSNSYHCRSIHEGIRRYFSEKDREITFINVGFPELEYLIGSHSNESLAILCWLDFEHNVSQIQALGVPYLNLRESSNMSNLGLQIQFEGEGEMAAEFFIEEMGYESLIFVGIAGKFSHQRRFREFQRATEQRHLSLKTYWIHPRDFKFKRGPFNFDRKQMEERYVEFAQLLKSIHQPAGIFCADERIALNLYHYAQHLGIRVPEEVSILGVGSRQRAEAGGTQAISVVQMDHVQQGYFAAQLMEHALTRKDSNKSVTLHSDGIIHRGTTTRRAYSDALVRRVYELIDQDRSITVTELCRRLNASRRTLESRFRTVTNLGIAKAIDYERFHHAKQLLKSHRYSHQAIAGLAGYRNHKQMIRSFGRFAQMSPKQYAQAYLNAN